MTTLRCVCFALVFALAGCEFSGARPDGGVEADPRPAGSHAVIDGFTHDVEYSLISFMFCQDETMCFPPLLIAGFPPTEAAKIYNAHVTAIAPGGATAGAYEGLTGPDGLFSIRDVAMADHQMVYLNLEVDPSAPAPDPEMVAPRAYVPDLEWLPTDFSYLKTTTAKPIFTANQTCFNQRAVALSDIGILQAVAKRMSLDSGNTVTVANLLNPELYGGVVVNWNLAPDEVYGWSPFFETTSTFSVGQTFAVSFLPPGDLPPDEQSDLGFAVVPEDDPSILLGLNVAVLPPNGANPTEVVITGVDPITSEEDGRPIPFEPMTVMARPGEVTYVDAYPFPPTVFGEALGPEFCATP